MLKVYKKNLSFHVCFQMDDHFVNSATNPIKR